MSDSGRMRLWAPLLLAGAMTAGAGFAAPADAHRRNGYYGFNGCGCPGNGYSGYYGFNGGARVAYQRVPVYGWHTRTVPVVTNGFNGCNGYSGYYGYNGWSGYNGYGNGYGYVAW
jgi:hypothetical protein